MDVERFLRSIKNITKANDESENHEILEIVRGKLTQSAGLWFDNNEHNFKKWSDFEIAFRNRYFSTTMIHKKFNKLQKRTQLPDEPVTSYIDDVINLCREIDSNMSDSIIIRHLMSGINPDFKKEISRPESCMDVLNEFLKYAKIEQDLYDTFEKSNQLSIENKQHNININYQQVPSFTAMINQPKQYNNYKKRNDYSYPLSSQSSVFQQNSIHQPEHRSVFISRTPIQINSQQKTFNKKHINTQFTSQQQFNNCKICGRTNHQTIDCFHKRTTGCFNCAGSHDGGVPSKFMKPSTITSSPVYIKIRVDDQPTEAIIDTVVAHVATNLITSTVLGSDWINSNHVHLYGDQKQLTIPNQHDQLILIPYVEPTCINYPALLVQQITLPPYSQKLVDITCQVTNANNLIFEPYERYTSKFIFIPHTLLNINKNQAKVLLINAQNQPQTLPKNTRIGSLSSHSTSTIYATTQIPTEHNSFLNENQQLSCHHHKQLKRRAVSGGNDNSNQIKLDTHCHRCHEYFLSGNDLQKHLRAERYSEQIRKQILESTKHIENRKHQLAIQDIL
ncbi:unnamed protein product [Rotaria sp. Silwood1]|nr:unnamed protein product [Rotaria sp. Silwood1]CAF3756042.1 unnamed protein product [Rotaria sp. Silwood1]CAF3808162.1 unnamed protein product [Rotaria sp. Silwood1]CAF5003550.1 unnamed protein product [Rotaria sp. Silwood1]